MITVSIIGTAGRNGLYRRLTSEVYERAISSVLAILNQIAAAHSTDISKLLIKSGGAALSDHIAVILYRRGLITSLHLHLPCDFSKEQKRFIGNPKIAESANSHHSNFSSQLGIDSLGELAVLITGLNRDTCSYDLSNGFFARNRKIAKCDYLIALTFPTDSSPRSNPILSQVPPYTESSITPTGGTGNTWKQAVSAGRILLVLT